MKPDRLLEAWKNKTPSQADWRDVESVLEFLGFEVRRFKGKTHYVASKGSTVITIGAHYRGHVAKVSPDTVSPPPALCEGRQMKYEPTDYDIRVEKIVEPDDSTRHYFKAYTAEMGEAVVEEGENPQEAVAGLIQIMIPAAFSEYDRLKVEPPPPFRIAREYSGKFITRLPKSVHAALDCMAVREGVSLNSMIQTILAEAVGANAPIPRRSEKAAHVAEKKARYRASETNDGR